MVIQSARAHLAAGRTQQARAALRQHVDRVPGDLDAARLLTVVHDLLREYPQAAACLARCALIHKSDPRLQYELGEALLKAKDPAQAAAAFDRSIAINPAEPMPYWGLARARLAEGNPQAALLAARTAVSAAPNHPDSHFTLCSTFASLGRFPEAVEAARHGLSLGDDERLLQAAIYAMNVSDGFPNEELAGLHRRLGSLISNPPPRSRATFPNTRNPDRPLRLGLLSCDFHLHSCAFFLEGLLATLDRSRLWPILYSTTGDPDEVTKRFQALAPMRDLTTMSEDQAAAQVTSDAIDIMLDLSGWVSPPQMKLLARRLAPLQGTYLGYPNTTGVPAIDFRIIDAITDPPGAESQCTETLIRLPRCFLAFTPSPSWPPSRSPRQPSDPITFGSFNNIMKISQATASLWNRVLQAVPTSRLLLKSPRLPEELLNHHRAMLIQAGIPEDRLTLHPFIAANAAHIELYHKIDIALDTFPYHGTTTTCEALWMGVPTITLQGDSHRSRVGASLLSTVGLPDLVAKDEDQYVQIASDLADDHHRLATLHSTLRDRMAASPLCDARGLASTLESALRDLWRSWCSGQLA
jgi:predicted O-linked N-acetylglucosamine transferase (SPINDLY family)